MEFQRLHEKATTTLTGRWLLVGGCLLGASCAGHPTSEEGGNPGGMPIHHLTSAEYNNTVAHLLGTTLRPADYFLPPRRRASTPTSACSRASRRCCSRGYDAAEDLAADAFADKARRAKILICEPASAKRHRLPAPHHRHVRPARLPPSARSYGVEPLREEVQRGAGRPQHDARAGGAAPRPHPAHVSEFPHAHRARQGLGVHRAAPSIATSSPRASPTSSGARCPTRRSSISPRTTGSTPRERSRRRSTACWPIQEQRLLRQLLRPVAGDAPARQPSRRHCAVPGVERRDPAGDDRSDQRVPDRVHLGDAAVVRVPLRAPPRERRRSSRSTRRDPDNGREGSSPSPPSLPSSSLPERT